MQTGLKKSQIISYSIYGSDGFFFKQLPFSQNALTLPVCIIIIFLNFVANCVFYWTKQNFLKFVEWWIHTLCSLHLKVDVTTHWCSGMARVTDPDPSQQVTPDLWKPLCEKIFLIICSPPMLPATISQACHSHKSMLLVAGSNSEKLMF